MFDLESSHDPGRKLPPTCLVRLIDRRTGKPMMIAGAPLQIFTRDPSSAARDLMSDRNRAHWEVRIDRLVQKTHLTGEFR